MAKKHSKKKGIFSSVFYRVYAIILLLFLVALACGLWYAWGYMKDYEASRPIYVAREAFRMFEEGDYDSIYDYDTSVSLLQGESRQEYSAYMKDFTEGKQVELKDAFSSNDGEKNYSVRLDGKKFATLTLSTTGEKTPHNNDTWQISSVTTMVFQPKTYTIIAPADSVVTVDGRTLGEGDVTESGITTKSEGLLPKGLTSPTMTKYTVARALGTPEVVSTDRFGARQEAVEDKSCDYSFPLAYDEIPKDYYDRISYVAKKMANYTSEDRTKDSMMGDVYNDSPAAKYVYNFNNQWCPAHIGYDFENFELSHFYVYSDDCFSCEVNFDYVIHYRKADDNVYPTTYTMYFKKYKEGYKLYNFTMN